MMKDKRIGFIGGGAMAQALIRGMLKSKLVTPGQISVCDISPECRIHLKDAFQINVYNSNTPEYKQLIENSNVLFLAVKPNAVPQILTDMAELITPATTLVSVAAGITLSYLGEKLPKIPIVRVMPNTPASVGAGISAISLGEHIDKTALKIIIAVFTSVGQVINVQESLMDSVTALSGSGPGYAFLIIEALANAGVKEGLSRQDALLLASQTLLGAAQMVIQTGEHPAKLRDMVTSPGGTTMAGLYILEQRGVRASLMEAVAAAAAKSREMGQEQ
jgi:pyrroline-5-carboxylate reductase